MQVISSFFRLVRWPNLFFIALTQWLFYFIVVRKLHYVSYSFEPRHHFLFYVLMTASVFIAAGGYIINDYFDLHIDTVNKPEKVVVDRAVKRRWAIVWHLLFSGIGLGASFYVSYRTGYWIIAIANLICVALLWFYSTHFKKQLLIGNLVISALTAWVIVVIYFFAGAGPLNYNGWHEGNYRLDDRRLYELSFIYAGFAFIISLIREVIKDLEDMYGDAQYQCKTMPIVWGVPVSKMFVAVWMIVCCAALLIIELYMWQSGWWPGALYTIFLVILPLLYVLVKLYAAKSPPQYHKLSNLMKLIMLTGIMSMLFFLK
jgi:4-hydroxybenzoate polyprenyltransferase